MTDTLDSPALDSGCVDDSSDPVGSDESCTDDSSPDDACSDSSWSDDADCSETDSDFASDAAGRDHGADACGTDDGACGTDADDGGDGRDDGPCDTDPRWDDTLSAVPTDDVTATTEVTEVGQVVPSTGPSPLVALPAAALASLPAAAPVSPFAGVPGLGGDTEAILGSVSRQIADAGTVAHAPFGVFDPAADAALGRIDVTQRATGSMAGLVHQQEITNSVRENEQTQSADEEAIRTQGFAERVESGLDGTFGSLGPF